jgi:indole-3-glycerol phosphate synthase
MDILEIIANTKRSEIKIKKNLVPVKNLEGSEFFRKKPVSFYNAIDLPEPSIIAEFKRRSPSKGIINDKTDICTVVKGYEKAGVTAMSILTDKEFFGGDESDMTKVAGLSEIPLLRKDFIIDEYQIIEAKAIGASAILLIASLLTRDELSQLTSVAVELDLDILFEIHNEKEIGKRDDRMKIIGVNNRDLRTFKVNLGKSVEMLKYLPEDCLKIAESGFTTYEEAAILYSSGYDAFLIGELFMKTEDPGETATTFIKGLKNAIK